MPADVRLRVLLVEDNPGDARLVAEALRDAPLDLSIVRDGAEALRFLARQGDHSAAGRPDLILLDLNLPKRSGLEVLQEIKADRELKRIPVVVLSGSSGEDSVRRCYELSANCFVPKHENWQSFVAAVKLIQEFWFSVVSLPPRA